MTDLENQESAERHNARRPRHVLIAIVFTAAVVAAGLWLWNLQRRGQAERAAAESLEELGAIVVVDGGSGRAASVNLSTISDEAKLAAAVELLPKLHWLTSLDASRTAIEDEHLETIGRLRGLTTLSLNETAIGDEGAARLRRLGDLQALYLASTEVTGAAFDDLAGMQELKILDASASRVRGNLAPLAKLPKLDWLILRNLPLGDEDLSELGGSASLTRLSLEGTTFSDAGLQELKEAAPGLSVSR
jgi:hypothetical protein